MVPIRSDNRKQLLLIQQHQQAGADESKVVHVLILMVVIFRPFGSHFSVRLVLRSAGNRGFADKRRANGGSNQPLDSPIYLIWPIGRC
jgi:hypothetical protein